ncbi:MAG: 30S ribosomal protein S2 [Anaerolineales bacterium]|nr:30S ribosomal protein S2 [Anaerolineales bacterium]
MAIISMRALLETGVHFGHRSRRWNPKMKRYIFTERNGIHIIDLQQTIASIEEYYQIVRDMVSEGGTLLFVGTKRQAQEAIEAEASRCNMPYVNQRWLGGTLTNWRTIRERIQYLNELESRRDQGEFDLLTKKEALQLGRKIENLNFRLGGIRDMTRLPNMLFMVDTSREETAVHEANILNIPIIAMVDTNCNPDRIDYVIPSNDDAIRAIKLITSKMADAVLEGMAMRKEELDMLAMDAMAMGEVDHFDEEEGDEVYLGEATLAKLRNGTLRFAGDEKRRKDIFEEEE